MRRADRVQVRHQATPAGRLCSSGEAGRSVHVLGTELTHEARDARGEESTTQAPHSKTLGLRAGRQIPNQTETA